MRRRLHVSLRPALGLGLALGLALLAPREAWAVRFTLGVAANVTPVVIDPQDSDNSGFLLGLRPVLDVEVSRYFAIGAYAPFTLVRAGGNQDDSKSGAESVFGLSASGRYPIISDRAPEEALVYGTLRGGFGTNEGRAGPFVGVALGGALTWLETGRGLFVEVEAGHLGVPGAAGQPIFERWSMGVSIGVVFRLGGEAWQLGTRINDGP